MKRRFAVLLVLIPALALASSTFNIFNPGPSGPVKSNGTYKLVAEVASDIYTLFGCSGSASQFLNGAGGCTTPAGSGTTLVASVPTNETFSNTTVVSDANLTFTGLVNGMYGWHCYITYTVGSPQTGLVGVTSTGTIVSNSYSVLPLQSGSAPMVAPNFGTTSTLAGTTTNSAFELDGRVTFTTTSGNAITLQFATSLAASPLTIGAASWCTMNKVA